MRLHLAAPQGYTSALHSISNCLIVSCPPPHPPPQYNSISSLSEPSTTKKHQSLKTWAGHDSLSSMAVSTACVVENIVRPAKVLSKRALEDDVCCRLLGRATHLTGRLLDDVFLQEISTNGVCYNLWKYSGSTGSIPNLCGLKYLTIKALGLLCTQILSSWGGALIV
jgi:hypothetical protein